MVSRLSIVINHLRPFMGALADTFIAKELAGINTKYCGIEHVSEDSCILFPHELPPLSDKDLDELLKNITMSLEFIVGPHHATGVVQEIRNELSTVAVNPRLVRRSSRLLNHDPCSIVMH